MPFLAFVWPSVLPALLVLASLPATRVQAGGVEACDRLLDVALAEATVVDAQWRAAGPFEPPAGDAVDVGADFCRVSVVARPTSDSEIGIEVWLPEARDWNGRLWGWGTSGFGGSIATASLGDAVGRGYATVATDGGHRGRGTDWALGRPEKVVDLGHRAVHLAAVHARALVGAHYGEPPRHAYFSGFSTGGTQGLRLAQRYPDDYDGIVAGGADQDWTGLYLWLAQLQYVELADPARHVSPAQLAALAEAAVAVCGDPDGVVRSPDRCAVEAVLGAYEPTEAAPALTASQLGYLRRLYAGPPDPTGDPLPAGYAPGSEAGWDGVHFGPAPGEGSWVAGYLTAFFRNLAFGDSTWSPDAFQLDRDAARTRAALADALDATDPDLGRFAERGGKLIVWHGWADPLVPPGFTLRYVERVEEALGADAAAAAVRLFLVPGVGHTAGETHRRLSDALERWVEPGAAPVEVSASGADDDTPEAASPLCAWPRVAGLREAEASRSDVALECARPNEPRTP